ncbi:ChbG/HpnK family deacetylase [Pseudodesulfovibrio senegalensis]|uniref:ChbG/HpnK family deacetylase n=1 Tax=Pseudodesulfovibrio senegalensis TaxID=1721087 RepID=A0A6N6N0R2_9BACT|nr:ChbG/HpnK family deacetylase [Pseudodesulfovibrio senegalensis]KAB1440856.1 ChbG/HpnK family deacetylase [Pseudodesulfovibrio senegalensis]
MNVVINVDDSGLHPAVRRAVQDLHARGMVSSTTVLANGPDVEQAAKMQGVGLGAHLNLLRGRPVLPADRVTSLVGEDGLFLGDYTALFARYVTGRIDHAQVEAELDAQIGRLRDLGIELTHFDSEKHIHAWPTIMHAVGKLAARHNIRWVRRPRECSEFTRLDKGGVRVKFLSLCSLLQRRPKGVDWPDSLWGIADQGRDLLPQAFLEYTTRHELNRPDAVVEICCHPGLPKAGDGPLPAEFGPMRVDAQWQDEYDALCSPDWAGVFRELGAEIVSYGDIEPRK